MSALLARLARGVLEGKIFKHSWNACCLFEKQREKTLPTWAENSRTYCAQDIQILFLNSLSCILISGNFSISVSGLEMMMTRRCQLSARMDGSKSP
jgi:hypothetical protein